MLSDIFLNSPLASIGLWLLLSVTDSLLTVAGARAYQRGAKEHLILPGSYELEPGHQEDVDHYRALSFRFILGLILYAGILWIVHLAAFKSLFALVWGGLILLQLAIHLRHFGNLVLFHYARHSMGVSGQIRYARWLSLRMSGADFFGYGLLFMTIYLFTGSLIILGGAIACLLIGIKHQLMSMKSSTPPAHDSNLT
jgi:hypothetical protein